MSDIIGEPIDPEKLFKPAGWSTDPPDTDQTEYRDRRRELYVKRLIKDVKLPSRATEGSAGFDFFAPDEYRLEPGEFKQIPLGIAVEIPKHMVLLLQEKSGLSLRYNIQLAGGVIDHDYRGEVSALYYNNGTRPAIFKKGEKVVQGILVFAFTPEVIEVEELTDTDRGENGFGSTGV